MRDGAGWVTQLVPPLPHALSGVTFFNIMGETVALSLASQYPQHQEPLSILPFLPANTSSDLITLLSSWNQAP